MQSSLKSGWRRRGFLAGVGTLGMTALMRPLLSEAQGAVPKRLLIVHRPCGTRQDKWFPTSGGVKDWAMTPLLSSFEAVRNDIVIMHGVDVPRGDSWPGDMHAGGMICMMGPAPSMADGWTPLPGQSKVDDVAYFSSVGPSVDQELQKNVAALQGTVIPSLQLGASLESMKGAGPEARLVISYADAQVPLWPESRPDVAFNSIFANVMTGAADPLEMQRAQLRNKSVLDFVTEDLSSIRTRLPASQLPKLDSHLNAIRDLETRLNGTNAASCNKPTLGAPLPGEDSARHTAACEQQLQLIKSAFQCDLTRVATLTYGQGTSSICVSSFPTLSVPGYGADGHHEVSHGGTANDYLVQEQVDKFYGDITGKFLLDLKNIPEGNGSMLDNTLVVYMNEVGEGASHSTDNSPFLVAGGKSLGLNGGSYLQFTNRTLSDFWVEVFQRFGHNKTSLGHADWNRGPLPGLFG